MVTLRNSAAFDKLFEKLVWIQKDLKDASFSDASFFEISAVMADARLFDPALQAARLIESGLFHSRALLAIAQVLVREELWGRGEAVFDEALDWIR